MSLGAETFQGLNAVLEDYRYPIARRCHAVEICLEYNRDNLRGFFEQCFSLLLKQVFGYEGSSWLNSIAKGGQEADTKALLGLLAPGGSLLRAVQSADADDLIKFEFPLNRLPALTQQLLQLETGRNELEKWPQYAKHILVDAWGNCHVHLNLFEYFAFWTAFYVLRSSQALGRPQPLPRDYGSLAPGLGSVRKALRVHKDKAHASRHPYLRLLQLHLEHFLPRSQQAPALTHRPGLHSLQRSSLSDVARSARGRIFFCTLVEFWLTDGDEPIPLPLAKQGSQDVAASWKATTAVRPRSFYPPSEDLIEALASFAHYSLAFVAVGSSELQPLLSVGWLPATPCDPAVQLQGRSAGYAPPRLKAYGSAPCQAFLRRLFRFLYRALRLWPESQPLPSVVHLWLSLAVPWTEHRFNLYDWECYVLSASPFLLDLLPIFLDLLNTRVSTRGDAALSDLVKAFQALQGSPQLLELLRILEGDLLRYTAQAGRRPEGPYADVLPFIADQRQEWINFASAGQVAADEESNATLFGTDQRSAAAKVRELLTSAAGAAKEELLASARDVANRVLPMAQLTDALSHDAPEENRKLDPIEGIRRGTWSQLCYKGNWMHRPLSSQEIWWLVRALVWVSDAANDYLGIAEGPSDACTTPQGLSKMLGKELRRRGLRVNLRPLGNRVNLAYSAACLYLTWTAVRTLFSLLLNEK